MQIAGEGQLPEELQSEASARKVPDVGDELDPSLLFDQRFYLATYPDLVRWKGTAQEHFRLFGAAEGRRCVDWFDHHFYCQEYDPSLPDGRPVRSWYDAFLHFCRIGNTLGLSPNRRDHERRVKQAVAWFDVSYYTNSYEDLRMFPGDAWEHFCRFGWRENRNPNCWLDSAEYRASALKGVAANPLVHFRAIGMKAGVRPSPGKKKHGSVELLAAKLALESLTFPDQSDVDLIMGSWLFDHAYYNERTGCSGSRLDAVHHYLETGAADGIDPSPHFETAFYRTTYSRPRQRISCYAVKPDDNPLVHYLRIGARVGFYRQSALLNFDLQLIRDSGRFDAEFYGSQLLGPPVGDSLEADYVIFGHVEGRSPARPFDGHVVNMLYRPLLGEALGAPFAYFLKHSWKCWLFSSQASLEHRVREVRSSPHFEPDFYRRAAGLDETWIDPAMHYAVTCMIRLLPTSPTFDTSSYCSRYRDMADGRVNPLLHFTRHGISEGRVAVDRLVPLEPPAPRERRSRRRAVLIFSHEDSRTGAPIVALNLARALARTFHVVVWIGSSGGALLGEFRECADRVVSGWGSPSAFASELDALKVTHMIVGAIVNSVVSHPVVERLLRAEVPILSLIHEFAENVWPPDALPRMMLLSDMVVFPARIVRDSAIRAARQFAVQPVADHLIVRPQGQSEGRVIPTESSVADDHLDDPDSDRSGEARVVLGVGFVSYRKGTDIFLHVAQELLKSSSHDWKFVWVGGGYVPEKDKAFSIYLRHHVETAGLAGKVEFVDESDDLAPFWKMADVFFLSSRLDPFPNVSLDALKAGVPVVCFREWSGTAELEELAPALVRAVSPGSITDAAAAIVSLAQEAPEGRRTLIRRNQEALDRILSFDLYAKDVIRLLRKAASICATRLQTGHETRKAARWNVGRLVPEIFLSRLPVGMPEQEFETSLNYSLYLRNTEEGRQLFGDVDGDPWKILQLRRGSPPPVPVPIVGKPDRKSHAVHFHLTDPSALEMLLQNNFWLQWVLAPMTVLISGPAGVGAISVSNSLPNVVGIAVPAATAIMGLRAVVEHLSRVGGGPEFLTHCAITKPLTTVAEIPLDLRELLAGTVSGEAAAILSQDPSTRAVFAPFFRDLELTGQIPNCAPFDAASRTEYIGDGTLNGCYRMSGLGEALADVERALAARNFWVNDQRCEALAATKLMTRLDALGRQRRYLSSYFDC